ncbi:hypothetical protein [Alkalicoccus chagannorensis]|uniref:hypothetical protein n=1 Tax=Alkalicoccus chagannorensis TaxID=427072 RepID=UPI0003FBA9E0|nr:hypothetical protein [Alkalicoccus chagannorensis]
MTQTEEHPWHYPDIAFVRYCEKSPLINRGIYNTIDSMFYQLGYTEVVERRKQILSFIRFLQEKERKEKGFGRKGLRAELEAFLAAE